MDIACHSIIQTSPTVFHGEILPPIKGTAPRRIMGNTAGEECYESSDVFNKQFKKRLISIK